VLFAGVLAAIAGVIVSGFAGGGWQMPASPVLTIPTALGGLAQATLLTTYCYWGYYNICFLGGEVRRPERTIPRAILLSILFVAAFYVAMNMAALPAMHDFGRDAASHVSAGEAVRLQLVADIARSAFGSLAGRLMAALIIWTAFASVFSLLLGYSRVPYAAARDGNYFRSLAALHPRYNIPHRSLVALGVVATLFCFFSLTQVITMLVITRILLQFFLQHVGVILLRIQRPELERPFKMPLYPLPPLVAIAGFVFMLVNRSHAMGGLAVAAAIAFSGTLIYVIRARRLRQWPFAMTK
jgi:amino acid transporter